MKKIIISLILIYSIYCSFDSCLEENNYSNCTNNQIEWEGFSCYQTKEYIVETGKYDEMCVPFPDKPESQKSFWKLSSGLTKEMASSSIEASQDYDYYTPKGEKETYKKGEEIVITNGTMTKKDSDIINGRNTCYYKYLEPVSRSKLIQNIFEYRNITDENTCFNVDKFDDLKNLLNCAHSEVKYSIGNKSYSIATCFFIPSNKMNDDIKIFYKKNFIDVQFEEGIFGFPFEMEEDFKVDNAKNNYSNFFNKKNMGKLKKRKLQENKQISYEIVAKDKYGKKVKLTSGSEQFEILEKGSEPSNGGDDDDVVDIRKSSSSYLLSNMILLLIILFIQLMNFNN